MAGERQSGQAAAEVSTKKRKRDSEADEDNTSAQRGAPQPPDRASAEPGVRGTPDQAAKPVEQADEADSGAQGPYGDGDLALEVDLTAAALAAESGVAAAAGDFLPPLDAELEEELPMAVDPPSPPREGRAAAAAAEPAGRGGEPAGGAGVAGAAAVQAPRLVQAAPPAPSKQDSALLPQCAIVTGGALDAPEVSQRPGGGEEEAGAALPPLPPRDPSPHYLAVKAELAAGIIPPDQAGVEWERFPNHLGEGVRSRLLALATLHLRPGGGAPAAVRELPANSNRVLLGAATHCELYQERVVRALAQRVGVPLMVADVYSLKLDDLVKEEGQGGGAEEPYAPGGGAGDAWDGSDEEDQFLLQPRADKREGVGKDRVEERFLAPRARYSARNPPPGVAFITVPGPGAGGAPKRQLSSSKLAAATRAAKAAQEKGEVAAERLRAAEAAVERLQAAHTKLAVAKAALAKALQEKERVERETAAKEGQDGKGEGEAGQGAPAQPAHQPAASAAAPGAECDGDVRASGAAAAPPAQTPAEVSAGADGGAAAPGDASRERPASSAAVSKVTAPAVRRGDRVSYLGRPGGLSERVEQLQAAIDRVQSSSSARAKDYLPQLIVRRTLAAAQSQRAPRLQPADAPPLGAKGRVVGVAGDQVHVAFDEPFAGGVSLPGQRDKCGLACAAEDLEVVEDRDEPLVCSLQALFDAAAEQAEKGPLIVFIQNLDRLLRTHAADHFRKLEALLAGLSPRCLLFAGYCTRSLARAEAKRDGGPPSLSRIFGSLGGEPGMGAALGASGDELGFLDRLGRGGGRGQRRSVKGRLLARMLPCHLELHPPNLEAHAKPWKQMVEADLATLRQRSNRTALRRTLTRCGCDCNDWQAVSVADRQLSRSEVEQVVGVAAARQLEAEGPPPGADAEQAQQAAASGQDREGTGEGACAQPDAAMRERCSSAAPAAADAPVVDAPCGSQRAEAADDQPSDMHMDEAALGTAVARKGSTAAPAAADAAAAAAEPTRPPWTLRAEHIMAAADAVRKAAEEAAAQPERGALRDLAADQYEKQLLSEVIPPEEISVGFDDIGALEAVKSTLHEVVILPLQRPELFTRGSLTKPTKGLLLFGPPGTGKTMLAKAVASESGAHFINCNMSAITSKWFGEGERLVRALFALAHKLAPSVIFVDEIDSFLSKRGQSSSEHEALRKMKNEWMTHWDGLRTRLGDRVLVLAATNRPMDLDDAVIRRMPRRVFVPLPDAANRERILQVILKGEDLQPGFDFKEAAALTDGYSGSDLKNLCIAAAYCPIREFLEAERGAKGGGQAAQAAAEAAAAPPPPRGALPAALAAVAAAAPPPAPVQLRPISLADFQAALKQVTPSTQHDSASMSELRRWNDQYGEGGSRSKEVLAYYT